MSSPGQVIWDLAFQKSPIILTNGIASGVPGGMLPIIALTESLNLVTGLLTGENGPTLDNFFANFTPVPGSTLIDQSIAEWPFANQSVAANAVIANPLVVSLRMSCPARQRFGYFTRLAIMMALQATLKKHNAAGGTYVLALPTFFYTNCVMLRMSDITGGESAQPQTEWQLDFRKPLLTQDDATEAQNSLMSKLTGGTQISGDPTWSGLPPTVGDPSSLGGVGSLGALNGVAGAGVSSPTGPH